VAVFRSAQSAKKLAGPREVRPWPGATRRGHGAVAGGVWAPDPAERLGIATLVIACEQGAHDVTGCISSSLGGKQMRIQLWSYNYDPEPTGIGIVSTVWARGLRDRGHEVEVVAAHPHYPEPRWGTRLLPYKEVRQEIPVLRLPLWIGRGSASARYRQELTFMTAQSAATPFLSRPDVLVSASPSFPALLPAVANVRARRIPWVLWLHDLLPDGATATGLVDERGTVIRLARRLEAEAYRAADRIVVLSRSFIKNLASKGVPEEKIELIYDPATRAPARPASPGTRSGSLRILSMGNIGHSQGLTPLVQAFEARPDVPAEFVITGTGVAADEAQSTVRSNRVGMLGVVDDQRLEAELQSADVGFVSQRYKGSEFNIPSKLMNFMAYGLPILAAVNPSGEVGRIVRESRAGWVVDSGDAAAFPREVERLSGARGELRERASAARHYADEHFTQAGFVERFEQTLLSVRRGRAAVATAR
jgi:colanic acid biosynthesis glycosyl transferase WcaI